MRDYVRKVIEEAIKDNFGIGIGEIDFTVERPRDLKWGDLSSNVAFLLSKRLRRNPADIGNEIVKTVTDNRIFSKVYVEKGFINFIFSDEFLNEKFCEVLLKGYDFFKEDIGKGSKVQVEFVSANPTGPLHLGHGRGAVVGDALCNLLEFFGYSVTREYYINDAGNQVYMLGKSIYARYMELLGKEYKFPEDGYRGEYVLDVAKKILEEEGERLAEMKEEEAINYCMEYGLTQMLDEIKRDLEDINIRFDVWYSERSLYEKGLVEEVLKILDARGLIYEKDGALWFKSSSFGDDKDRVVRKSDGSYTYFASDIAYHYDKFKRGFDKVINLWGADHHGYEARIRAALRALDIDDKWLDIYFVQMVKLFRQGEEVKMSKRTGEFVTLRELIDEIGKDAVRYMFLTKRSDTPLSIDVDLVKQKSSENPVFYVQYAHARACGIEREMQKKHGISQIDRIEDIRKFISLLNLPEERALLKKVIMFGDDLKECAVKREPHVITYLLLDIASEFHSYYNHHRIVTDDINISMARYLLVKGIKTVISLGLDIIGVDRPERM